MYGDRKYVCMLCGGYELSAWEPVFRVSHGDSVLATEKAGCGGVLEGQICADCFTSVFMALRGPVDQVTLLS